MEANANVVVPGRRLGKLAPAFDKRTLRMAKYIEKRKLPKIPARHVLSKKTVRAFPTLGMMVNDALGDCTFASKGHAWQTWSTYGGVPWRPSDEAIKAAYFATGDHQDTGRNMLEILNYLRDTGLDGRKIYAFMAIDPKNHDQVRTAHYLFGGLDVGLSLPVTAQAQTGKGKVWDYLPGANGSEPGSWGGHDVNLEDTLGPERPRSTVAGTSQAGLAIITWGELQRVTWAFWDAYVDECYAILEQDYLGTDGKSPQGFSFKQLADDLKGL